MAITPADLKLFTSANNHGGAITATEVTGTNVFGIFTGAESAAGITEYACVYVKNGSAQTAFTAVVYVDSETNHPGVNAEIGLGTSAINGTETTPADAITAPAGVTFTDSDTEAAALAIGDIPAGQHKAVWIKFTIAPGTAAKNNYSVSIGIGVDTGE